MNLHCQVIQSLYNENIMIKQTLYNYKLHLSKFIPILKDKEEEFIYKDYYLKTIDDSFEIT